MARSPVLATIIVVAGAVAIPGIACADWPFGKPDTSSRSSTIIGSPLTTPHSARNMAMGGAGVADPSTPANAACNPANLIGDDGVFTFYGRYRHYDFFDVHDAGIAATRTWRGSGIRGAVAVRQLYHAYQPIVERTVFLPEGTGSTYQPKEWGTAVALALGVSVGRATVAFGASGERMEEQLSNGTLTAWAFDIGANVGVPFENERGDRLATHLAAAVLNAGNGIDLGENHVPSPRQIRVGAGASLSTGASVPAPFSTRDVSVVTASVAVDVVPDDPRNDDVTALAGIELGFFESVYFRAGTGGRVVEQSSGISHGVGLAADAGPVRIRFDISTYPARSLSSDEETIWSVSLDYRP